MPQAAQAGAGHVGSTRSRDEDRIEYDQLCTSGCQGHSLRGNAGILDIARTTTPPTPSPARGFFVALRPELWRRPGPTPPGPTRSGPPFRPMPAPARAFLRPMARAASNAQKRHSRASSLEDNARHATATQRAGGATWWRSRGIVDGGRGDAKLGGFARRPSLALSFLCGQNWGAFVA